MEKIVQSKIDAHIADQLKQWSYTPEGITRKFNFDTFVDAFSFMTAFGIEAEKKDHHPDWSNSYNKVTIALYSHEADGITQTDFNLAKKADQLFKRFE
jgi:4a-hydroxytetrahydrobiopterin dehydratase